MADADKRKRAKVEMPDNPLAGGQLALVLSLIIFVLFSGLLYFLMS